MAWYLINEDERISIGRERIVGRDDFADAPVLSRQHLRFVVTKQGLTVRDLDSRNGTSLNGAPLSGDSPQVLRAGDVLKVSDYEFRVGWTRPHYQIGAIVVGVILALKALDPTAAFGRAVGTVGWTAFVLSAIVATAVVSAVLGRVVPAKYGRGYVVAILLAASVVDILALLALVRVTPLANVVARARIEHHCVRDFKLRQCVRQVEACASCTIKIEKYRRDQIADRIVAERRRRLDLVPAANRRLASPGR